MNEQDRSDENELLHNYFLETEKVSEYTQTHNKSPTYSIFTMKKRSKNATSIPYAS